MQALPFTQAGSGPRYLAWWGRICRSSSQEANSSIPTVASCADPTSGKAKVQATLTLKNGVLALPSARNRVKEP